MDQDQEIVLLDGQHRYFRASVLKARGYSVFTTEHVVEVCLRWSHAHCAALIIGPQLEWGHVATLCEWIKMNDPEKPIILLGDQHRTKPARVDAIVPTQPIQNFVRSLHALLPGLATQPGDIPRASAANKNARVHSQPRRS